MTTTSTLERKPIHPADQIDRAQDARRANAEADKKRAERAIARTDIKIKQVELIEDPSDADRQLVDLLRAERAIYEEEEADAINEIGQIDHGSRDDERVDRDTRDEAFRRFVNGGMQSVGDPRYAAKRNPLQFEIQPIGNEVAELNPLINAPQSRPSGGWETESTADYIRTLKYAGGIRNVAEVRSRRSGNNFLVHGINSNREAEAYSDTGATAATDANIAPQVVTAERQPYRSGMATLSLLGARDFEIATTNDQEEETALTLIYEINSGQNHDFTGDKAQTSGGGLTNSVVMSLANRLQEVETTAGTSGNTGRNIIAGGVDALIDRLAATSDPIDPQYYEPLPMRDERGPNPLGTGLTWMFNKTVWSYIYREFRKADNLLVGRGETAFSGAPIYEYDGHNVVWNNHLAALPALASGRRDFATDDLIWTILNGAYMRIYDLPMRVHRDPYGTPGQNSQVGIMVFAEAFCVLVDAFGTTKSSAGRLYQAASS